MPHNHSFPSTNIIFFLYLKVYGIGNTKLKTVFDMPIEMIPMLFPLVV